MRIPKPAGERNSLDRRGAPVREGCAAPGPSGQEEESMPDGSVAIRPATPQDMPALLAM